MPQIIARHERGGTISDYTLDLAGDLRQQR